MSNFFLHPNFPEEAGRLLNVYNGEDCIESFPFPTATPDKEWIECAAKRQPKPLIMGYECVLVTNEVEIQLLRESGCSFVYFTEAWQDLSWPEQAWRLVKYWLKIQSEARKLTKQSLLQVSMHGNVHRLNL